MNIKLTLTFIIASFSFTIIGQDATDISTAQVNATVTTNLWGQQNLPEYAAIIFNPTWEGKPNPYQTTSINSAAVNALYGTLGIDAQFITYIQQTYFFLEYCTKVELAARIAALGHSLNVDVDTILEQSSAWKNLIAAVNSKTGSFESTVQRAYQPLISPAYEDVRGTINAIYWKDVAATEFWTLLPVTQDLIVQSEVWQSYNKYLITQMFEQDINILALIKQSEEAIFNYIPNIEVAYYQPSFTNIRNSAEIQRLNLLLVDAVRNRAHNVITDWKSLDIQQTFSATKQFATTPFFKALFYAQSNPNQTLIATSLLISSTDAQPIITADDIKTDPLLVEKITAYSMIKLVQSLTASVYSSENLTKTMNALQTAQGPQPSLLLFTPDDAPFLEDRNAVVDAQAAKTQNSGQTVAYQSFNDFMNDPLIEIAGWDEFWSDVKNTVIDAGKSVGSGIAGLALETASIVLKPTAAVVSIFSPSAGEDILKTSTQLAAHASKDFAESKEDALSALSDIEDAAEQTIAGAGYVLGSGLSFILRDTKIGADLEMTISTLGEAFVDSIIYPGKEAVEIGFDIVELSADAVNVAGSFIADSVIAARTQDSSIFGQDFVDGLKGFAADLATSLLSAITLAVKLTVNYLKDFVGAIGYLTSFIVDEVYKAIEGLSYVGAWVVSEFGTDVDPSDISGQVTNFLESHRKFSEAVVNTAILITVGIATGGAGAAAMAGLNAGIGLFQIVGGEQADESRAQNKQDQEDFLQSYSVFVDNNKIIIQEQMDDWTQEFDNKFTNQISNQERGLGFYQNFTNSYFESIKESLATSVGSFLGYQLKPQANGLVFADVGSVYGLSTGAYNFNPSQGFPLYSEGRTAFSQEVAVSPALITQGQTADESFTTTRVPEKFWFNQKETVPLDTSITEVDIKLRVIYVLNEYYIGLYFGGKPYDIQTIINTSQAPIDPAHHAKMLVYKKRLTESQTQCGLYEHEGKGWLSENLSVPEFSIGTWYRMKMQLNGNVLNVKVWEGDTEPAGQPFQVTVDPKEPLKTIGIISSGAAVEYQIIKPEATITPNTTVRTQPQSPFETQREVTARQTMHRYISPKLGSLNLAILDIPSMLKGQYIYKTQDTQLRDAQQQPLDDYVLLCRIQPESKEVDPATIGITLEEEGANGIISLLSGNYYDTNAQKVGYYGDVFGTYKVWQGPLTDTATQEIETERRKYLQQFTGPYNFGTISLNATSIDDIVKGQYIYRGVSPAPELLDSNQQPLYDQTLSTTLFDYFLLKQGGTTGLRYADSIQTMESLITGYEYNRTSTQPTNADRPYDAQAMLTEYAGNFPLRPDLLDAITKIQERYATIAGIEAEVVKAEETVLQTLSKVNEPLSGSQVVIITTATTGADESISQNQIKASDGYITSGF